MKWSLIFIFMASSSMAATHVMQNDQTELKSVNWPDGTVQVSSPPAAVSPGGSTTQVQFNNSGAFGGSADMTFHSGSALLNLTDTSNPYLFATGYGIKMVISGHLGTPTTLYGMYFVLGGAIAGDTYGYYADVNNASAATNYGAFLSASSGARNYSIWADAGQVLVKSSMTVMQGINVSTVTVLSSGSPTYEATFSTASAFYHLAISTSGHLISGGALPTISSCGSGPAGSVVGDDNVGTITVGAGSVTSCTLTFANTWGAIPSCVITDNSTTIPGDISAISATAFTVSFNLSLGGGTIWYRCSCSGLTCR